MDVDECAVNNGGCAESEACVNIQGSRSCVPCAPSSVGVGTHCGVGACAASGSTTCSRGVVVDSCLPGQPAASDATCDNIDNDCNGAIDDGFVAGASHCGLGACGASGTIRCSGGAISDSCVPGTPTTTSDPCNGRDDDCDGSIDEDDAPSVIECGRGACTRSGAATCTDGMLAQSCIAGIPAEDDANCNGIDEDCDGSADEDFIGPQTTCVVTGCSAMGTIVCDSGAVLDTCTSMPSCASEIDCTDSSDNDEDGAADCADADCYAMANCQVSEICGNSVDDDRNGVADCADPACAETSSLCGFIPPLAEDVAPPLPTTLGSSIWTRAQFLIASDQPLQFGVADSVIDAKRASLVRGTVRHARNGEPLPGVRVEIIDHPEFGYTRTNAHGDYNLLVNGGDPGTLRFSAQGFPEVDRPYAIGWSDYDVQSDVFLTPLDRLVTPIRLDGTATHLQFATSAVVEDERGTRTTSVLFPAGVTAQLQLADGTLEPFASGHFRATEYTVGGNGPGAMPAPVARNTVYTFATELSFDEAIERGATTVLFDRPVGVYVTSFLNVAVGTTIPVGFYDREDLSWHASDDAIVVQLALGEDGRPSMDTNGDGVGDTHDVLDARGISPAEVQQLSGAYPMGTVLWRAQVMHMTPCDINTLLTALAQAPMPPQRASDQHRSKSDTRRRCEEEGSRIGCQTRSLVEEIPIDGTDFSFTYDSERVPTAVSNSIDIAVTGPVISSAAIAAYTEIAIGGKVYRHTVPLLPNQSYTFTWDGSEIFGRQLNGRQPARIKVCQVIQPELVTSAPFGLWDLFGIVGAELTRAGYERIVIPAYDIWTGAGPVCEQISRYLQSPTDPGVAAWNINVRHQLDVSSGDIYFGYGATSATGTGISASETVALEVIDHLAPPGQADIITSLPSSASFGASRLGDDSFITVGSDPNYVQYSDGRPSGWARHFYHQHPGFPVNEIMLEPNDARSLWLPKNVAVSADHVYVTEVLANPNTGVNYWYRGRISRYSILRQNGQLHLASRATIMGRDEGPLAPSPGFQSSWWPASPYLRALSFESAGGPIVPMPDGSLLITDCGVDARSNTRLAACVLDRDGRVSPIPEFIAPGHNLSVEAPVVTKSGMIFSKYTQHLPGGQVETGLLRMNPKTRQIERLYNWWSCNKKYHGGPLSAPTASDGDYYVRPDQGGPACDNGFRFDVDRNSDDVYLLHLKYESTRIERLLEGASLSGFGTSSDINEHLIDYQVETVWTDYTHGTVSNAAFDFAVSDSGALLAQSIGGLIRDGVVSEANLIRKIALGGTAHAYDASTRQLYLFDESGRHVETRDGLTNTSLLRFSYDDAGTLQSVEASRSRQMTLFENTGGRTTRITSPTGVATALEYDANGRVAALVRADQSRYTMTYHGNSQLLATITDPRGHKSTFVFDADGKLVQDFDDTGFSKSLAETLDTDGKSVRITDGLGRSTIYTTKEDLFARQSSVVRPDQTLSSTTISSGHERLQYADGTTVTKVLVDDPQYSGETTYASRIEVRLPSGLESVTTELRTVERDDLGEIAAITSDVVTGGGHWLERWDAATRTLSQTSPDGVVRTQEFDELGRPTRSTGSTTRDLMLAYDDGTGLISQVSQGSRSVAYAYDSNGALSSIGTGTQTLDISRDVRAQVTGLSSNDGTVALSRGALGEISSLTSQMGVVHSFEYSDRGATRSYRVNGGAPTVATFDLMSEPEQMAFPTGGRLSMSREPNGRVGELTVDENIYSVEYDSQTGQLNQLSSADGNILRLETDGPLLTAIQWSGTASDSLRGRYRREYDASFSLKAEYVNEEPIANYVYDSSGRLRGAGPLVLDVQEDEDGPRYITSAGQVDTYFKLNEYGEGRRFHALIDGSEVYSKVVMQRRPDGKIESAVETVAGVASEWHYGYDASGRLEDVSLNGVAIAHYTYDHDGNRTARDSASGSESGTYDPAGRLLEYGRFAYAHDQAGVLRTRTDRESSSVDVFAYDSRGSLRQVELGGGDIIDYEVDAFGRRVSRRVNGSITARWLYRNAVNPVAELDAENHVVTTFIYGERASAPSLMTRGATTYRLIRDDVGSVRFVVDLDTNEVVQAMSYDEFGRVLLDTNPGFQPFGFAGGLYEPDTGLVRFGARDYDAYTGRWTAQDPILFAGGDANLYAYVKSDPINFVDPTGLLVDVVYSISRGELSVVDMTTGVNVVVAAHSGDKPLPGFESLGPIPVGKYEILASPPNRYGSKYRLESVDGTRNDFDKFTPSRGRFRLHRGTYTNGCINVPNGDDYSSVTSIIDGTSTTTVPDFFQSDWPFGIGNAEGDEITMFGYLRVIQ